MKTRRDAPSTAESRRCAVSGETTTPRANHTRITHRHTQQRQRHGTIYKGSTRNVIENMAASSQCGSRGAAVAVPEGLARHQRRLAYYRRRHHQLTEGIGFLSIKAILSSESQWPLHPAVGIGGENVLVVATGVYPFIFLINKMHRKSNF